MTRLGDSKTVRKGGRYARVMGTLWRSSKREKCGRAAMGLLMDIWSWCADQQESVIPERALRKLLSGDANGRRQLRELVDAKFLDVVEGGYAPHDWDEHSGLPGELRAPSDPVCDEPVSDVRRECDGLSDETVTGSVMRTTLETTQETPSPRARAFSQIPDPRSRERESARGATAALDGTEVERVGARKLIRREFSARYETAQDTAWTQAGSPDVDVLVTWLLSVRADREQTLRTTLDNFFADAFCRSIHFSIGHLAKHPDKYRDPREIARAPLAKASASSAADDAKRYPTQHVDAQTSWK